MTSGRHAGPARLEPSAAGPTERGWPQGVLLLLALGITAAIVAWGYLVYVAIDFGTSARDGNDSAWWLLGLATVGAIACLFFALLLGARLVARFRATLSPPPPARPAGGRRAAR